MHDFSMTSSKRIIGGFLTIRQSTVLLRGERPTTACPLAHKRPIRISSPCYAFDQHQAEREREEEACVVRQFSDSALSTAWAWCTWLGLVSHLIAAPISCKREKIGSLVGA